MERAWVVPASHSHVVHSHSHLLSQAFSHPAFNQSDGPSGHGVQVAISAAWLDLFPKYLTVPLGTADSPAQPDCLLTPAGSAPVHWGLEVMLGIKSRVLHMLEKALFLNLHPSLLPFYMCLEAQKG